MSDREEKFEKMLREIQRSYLETVELMEQMKAQNKTKTVTYKQLMGNKLTYQNILAIYRVYGLIDE